MPADTVVLPQALELSDEDILDALAQVPGYIDISTEDFRVVYHLAWQHALARLTAAQDSPAPVSEAQA